LFPQIVKVQTPQYSSSRQKSLFSGKKEIMKRYIKNTNKTQVKWNTSPA